MGLSINLKIIQQLEWIYQKLFLQSFLNTRSVKLLKWLFPAECPQTNKAPKGLRGFVYRFRKLQAFCI